MDIIPLPWIGSLRNMKILTAFTFMKKTSLHLSYTIRRKENIPIGNTGCSFHRIFYRVRKRTCCFIDVFPTYYRVTLGKPSEWNALSWKYPSDDLGLGKYDAIAKAVSICEATEEFYKIITK